MIALHGLDPGVLYSLQVIDYNRREGLGLICVDCDFRLMDAATVHL